MFELIANTASSILNAVVDIVTGRNRPAPSTDPCEEGACGVARRELEQARRAVITACYWLQLLNIPMRAAIWVLSHSLRDYAIALILLILLFGIFGIFLLFLIIVLAIAAIIVLPRFMAPFGMVLITAVQREQLAILAVQRDCPPSCQGDLTPSECNLGYEDIELPSTPFNRFLRLDR